MKPSMLTACCALAFLLLPQVGLAEPQGNNPFSGDQAAPPAVPTDGEDFEDGGDFGAPPGDFGFTPPSPSTPPPTFTENAAPDAPTPSVGSMPQAAIPPSSVTNRGSNLPRPTNRQAQAPTTTKPPIKVTAEKTKGKPAPKLADYLELDTAVKGLEVKSFDLADKEIKDVVLMISKWTGKNFILDSKVRGKITIIGPSQVTVQEAYQAFLSALDANGLTTVQSGKFIRIIESAEARRAPVKTYAGDYAPKDDQFITRVFQLKYINADEVQREFRDLTTRQGKLFAYEPTNSIIITDTGSNIQRIKDLLEVLDVKSFETSLHLLKIKNGSAKTISEMLSAIYGDDKKSGSAPRSFRRNALERTRGGGIISKILPDEATNSLVVLANQAGFRQLVQLVNRLDTKTSDNGRIHVYYCEYAKAEDLASTLASLSSGSSGGGRSRRSSTSGSGAPAGGAPGANSNPTGLGSSGPVTAELGEGVKVTADPPTNSLVITANSADFQVLKKVIRKLDIPRQQVFVETAILEVSLDNTDNIGVNYTIADKNTLFGGFIGDGSTLTKLISKGIPEGVTVPIIGGAQQNINLFGTSTTLGTFTALINLITTNSQTSVLSTPQIIALDNEKAQFKVQDVIPVLGSATAQSATSGAVQNIEKQPVGIDITLTPHINAASGVIRLEIEQTVDSIKDATGSVPEGLGKTNIATTTRKTTTSVVVKDGDFVALGGLMSDKHTISHKKVPLLGDIPVLGWLFKSQTITKTKGNMIILLHPRIIGSSYAAADIVGGQLKKRQEFLDKNISGDDRHKEEVEDLTKKIEQQKDRAKGEPVFDYRNFMEDELDKIEREQNTQSKREEGKSSPKEEPALLEPKDPALGLPEDAGTEGGAP